MLTACKIQKDHVNYHSIKVFNKNCTFYPVIILACLQIKEDTTFTIHKLRHLLSINYDFCRARLARGNFSRSIRELNCFL
uniref:Uncharacterized protein n=1 Tax=Arundo donax TaxID=35708 RepID=A0A0A9A867_ARUDO